MMEDAQEISNCNGKSVETLTLTLPSITQHVYGLTRGTTCKVRDQPADGLGARTNAFFPCGAEQFRDLPQLRLTAADGGEVRRRGVDRLANL
jgi:hypothetical protein